MGTPEGAAKNLYRGAKQRSKDKNIPFNLTYEWVLDKVLSGSCEVTGIPFIYGGVEERPPFAPSIDQIIPKNGYTLDNCQITVWIYNVAKGSNTHEDVLQMAKALCNKTTH